MGPRFPAFTFIVDDLDRTYTEPRDNGVELAGPDGATTSRQSASSPSG
jgi:hypothetical protein